MRRPSDGASPPEKDDYQIPEEGPQLPNLAVYERLIEDGVAAAEARRTSIDHVTARRLAIWLAARPQQPVFSRSLVKFAKTGEISPTFRTQLRIHARSGNYDDQLQAARLMHYCVARGAHHGPISENFGAACDELDRADVMLTSLYDRQRQGHAQPEPAWPEVDASRAFAAANRDPESQIISFVFDAATANTVMFAVAAQAGEREAHIREVERYGQTLPEGSYGRRNRDAIAARETRIAARLRDVERAYRTAIERDAMFSSPEATRPSRAAQRSADREIEPG
jgi:hypothetical protein